VAAAATLFSERGYHGASMQDIAERVRLLKGSLYAHVANKEELLLEIVSSVALAFATAHDEAIQNADAAPVQLRLAIRGHLLVLAHRTDPATVYIREWRHLKGQPATWIRETRERYVAKWRELFQRGIDQGAFRADLDPEIAAMLAVSAADAALNWRDAAGQIDVERIASGYADLLLAACARHGH
jgi:AcrR family transcriptional regulator